MRFQYRAIRHHICLRPVPIRHGIAVTGPVNQMGEVQTIGGVNDKVEGLFEIRQSKGLTGEQGIVILESNVTNLMLKDKVVYAVQNGKFHIWQVKIIDDGIEVLTRIPAVRKLEDGTCPEGSINTLADQRLFDLAEWLIEYGQTKKEKTRSKK